MKRIRVKSRRVEKKKEIVRPPQNVRTVTPNTLEGVYANSGAVSPRSITDLTESETDISVAVEHNLLTREFMVYTRMYRLPGSSLPMACDLAVPEERIRVAGESATIEYMAYEVAGRIAGEIRRRVEERVRQELLRLPRTPFRG